MILDKKNEIIQKLSQIDSYDLGFEILHRFFCLEPFFENSLMDKYPFSKGLRKEEALAFIILLSRRCARLFEAIRSLYVSGTAQKPFNSLNSLLNLDAENDLLIAAALASFKDNYDECEIYGRIKPSLKGSEIFFKEFPPLSTAKISLSALKLGVVIAVPKERPGKYRVLKTKD